MTVVLSGFANLVHAISQSKAALFGWLLLILLIATAAFAPYLGLPDPVATDLRMRMSPPTFSLSGWGPHPLGTDQLGRDILSRIVSGSRVTLTIGLAAVAAGGIVGTLLGLFAGYFGGIVDRVIMRLVDMQLAIPLMLLALIVVAAVGPSLQNLVLVLALTGWVRYARIVRGQVLAIRERDFIQSARAIGAGSLRIIFRHVLPNVLTPLVVVATLELARVVILESAMSFLGFGVQPPAPSWGRMLSEGRTYMTSAWWLVTFPGIAIVLTVLSVNLVGDWLRDYFDPKADRS